MNQNTVTTHIALMIPVALISLHIILFIAKKKKENLSELERLYCI